MTDGVPKLNSPPRLILCDWLFQNVRLVTMASDETMASDNDPLGEIASAAVAVRDGQIVWVGPMAELPEIQATAVVDGGGRLMTPGLIDCHTHLVWGGSRADEWQRRLNGVSYEQIAREGGGILSTVRATRQATEDELLADAVHRARQLAAHGVTTIEIKSGYGLTLDDELKMLRVARRVIEQVPVEVHPTLLAAHAVPPEYANRPDEYIDLVCDQIIPAASELATAVDVFTESIAFDLAQTQRVFRTAIERGLSIKVHAEQLSNLGGACLAAQLGALSADHLEYLDETGIEAMADSGTVATLLPGAFYFLGETQSPPIELLRTHRVPIALATDLNPGSSPAIAPLLMANMACTFWGLTPREALLGLTRHAARALRIEDRAGTIEVGKRADLAMWNVESAVELVYLIGHNPCVGVCQAGRWFPKPEVG